MKNFPATAKLGKPDLKIGKRVGPAGHKSAKTKKLRAMKPSLGAITTQSFYYKAITSPSSSPFRGLLPASLRTGTLVPEVRRRGR